MSENPYDSPEQMATSPFGKAEFGKSGAALGFEHVAPLCDASGWLKFLGILNIVIGVLYCITIIGAVIGWLPLWIGFSLNKAGVALRQGLDQQDPSQIHEGMRNTALVFKIVGVIAIIYLVLIALYILAVIAAIAVGAGAAVMS